VGALASGATALIVLFGFTPPLSERAASWAAVLLVADVGSFLRSLDVLTETVFTTLLVAALALFVRALASRAAGTASAAGLLLGAAVLVRPVGLYLVPLGACGLAVASAAARVPWHRALAAVLAFTASAGLLVGGWIIRNERVAGGWTLAPIVGHNLLHYGAARVVAAADGIGLRQAQEKLGIREAFYRFQGPAAESVLFGSRRYAGLFPESSRLTLVELDRVWARRATRILRDHPVLTARRLAVGAVELALAPPPLILLAKYGAYRPDDEILRLWQDHELIPLVERLARLHPIVLAASAASGVLLLAFWVLSAIGASRAPRELGLPAALALFVCLAYLVACSAGAGALEDRFRVPLVPVSSILAGVALARSRPSASP